MSAADERVRVVGGVPHPWHFIAEELLARGWNTADLALRMILPDYDEIVQRAARSQLVLDIYRAVGPNKPNCRLGDEDSAAIAKAFDVSPDFIRNLEKAWLANPAIERGDHTQEKPDE